MKRKQERKSVSEMLATAATDAKRGLFRRFTFGKHPSQTKDYDHPTFTRKQSSKDSIQSEPASPGNNPTSPQIAHRSSMIHAMRTRRLSVQAKLDDITADLERHALGEDPTVPKPGKRTGPNPECLPPVHIVGPHKGWKHNGTVIVLHGFTCNGKMLAHELLPKLRSRLGAHGGQYGGLKFVFLTAAVRTITCYDGNPDHNAWHDYFSDHGGSEGRPEIEEDIDVGQLEWSAAQVHAQMDLAAKELEAELGLEPGTGIERVGVIGQSQGSCTSLHSVLTHPKLCAGVFCSIGQLYSVTPVKKEKAELKIYTFNGAADDCIGCALSLRTYSRLMDAGFKHVRMHVQPHVGHWGSTDEEADLVCEALESWGLLSPPE